MPRPLISEALRGHGAVLRDGRGERFVDELLPRDLVSRAIALKMAEEGSDHVRLDATGLEDFGRRFPTIAASLAEAGLDPARDWLPVAPAAHYLSGGVLVDLDGATALPGLWAAGEVACTGVHGANRLASNSLLEGMVYGARCVEAILSGRDGPERTGALAGLEDEAAGQVANGDEPAPIPVRVRGGLPVRAGPPLAMADRRRVWRRRQGRGTAPHPAGRDDDLGRGLAGRCLARAGLRGPGRDREGARLQRGPGDSRGSQPHRRGQGSARGGHGRAKRRVDRMHERTSQRPRQPCAAGCHTGRDGARSRLLPAHTRARRFSKRDERKSSRGCPASAGGGPQGRRDRPRRRPTPSRRPFRWSCARYRPRPGRLRGAGTGGRRRHALRRAGLCPSRPRPRGDLAAERGWSCRHGRRDRAGRGQIAVGAHSREDGAQLPLPSLGRCDGHPPLRRGGRRGEPFRRGSGTRARPPRVFGPSRRRL